MAIDFFNTRTMLRALEERLPPKQFLLDTFFSDVEQSDTASVDIDVIKKGRKMAPFVNPLKEGKLVEGEAFATNTFKPPYIKPKRPTTAADLLNRQMGESLYSGVSPAQRAAKKLAEDLADFQDMVERREEWMARSALTTGTISVVGEGVDATITFGMDASHLPVLAGGALWSAAGTSFPLKDLRDWKDLIAKDSGMIATDAIFGNDVIETFLSHADVQAKLDNRRLDIGRVEYSREFDGVEYYGRFEGLDIWRYSEWFTPDAGGADVAMVPADGVIMGSRRARTARHYGAIMDLDAGLVPVRWFPKSWREKDPSAQILLLQSAPLVAMHQVDAFVYATVL